MRNRSMALVLKGDRILMVRTRRRDRVVWELPGGGIEPGETPEEAAIRELKEETGMDGKVLRPLNILHGRDGSVEYVFLTEVSPEQTPVAGTDPEAAGREQSIRAVGWMRLDELSERDRAFLWAAGLMDAGNFFELALSWGDEISWPSGEGREETR